MLILLVKPWLNHGDHTACICQMALERKHQNVRRGILKPKHDSRTELARAQLAADDDEVLSRVPSDNVNDLQYLLDMSVGTPPQKMKVP